MGGRGKAAHVEPDFGEDDLCGQSFYARGCDQLFDCGAKGRDLGLHLPIDRGDGGVESIDLPEMEAEQKAVVLGDAAAQGLAQLCRGGLQPPIG